MTHIPTTREREARYREVFRQLQERLSVPWHEAFECKLGREPRLRRGDKCSACPVNIELEIDRAVAELISDEVIQSATRCPYLAFTSALFFALLVALEAQETAKQSERVRVKELSTALKHINRALETLSPDRKGIEYLAAREDEEMFVRLYDVVRAEALISHAVKFLNENFERHHGSNLEIKKELPVKRGRRPALELRAFVRPCAHTWQELIGARPGKHNTRFHGLLQAAATTVLGPLDREPDWEGQIVAARSEAGKK
jgi:hypothetical protein